LGESWQMRGGKMLTLLKPGFPHRHNSNGSHDSICTLCLATVATVQYEWELTRHESAHVCDPANVYRTRQAPSPFRRVDL
jgi:hypothetical protein